MLIMANLSKKTTTKYMTIALGDQANSRLTLDSNPIETNATKNISDRFSAGGAKGEYTPGVATPRQPDDVSSPVVDEQKKDVQATDHLKSKQYNFHGSRCMFLLADKREAFGVLTGFDRIAKSSSGGL